ncbi:phage terminase small subunit P27 family [Mycobacterium xenopi]|uniref:phage terminase small subunit P27 family n=1 Tax=Mycobacterium xenopi TaxID=1789 RepID=UPI0015A7DE44|nr:phage terminase small subunit P27 family [Mycobacterium xenopi]
MPLKVLKGRGNGKDSMGRPIPQVPNFERGAPDPPEWLDDEARNLWQRVAPALDRLDLLKPEDREVFVAYCVAWSRFVSAVQTYQAEGMTVTNKRSGRVALHPAVTAAQQASRDLLRFAQDFGLTPAAELNLGKKPAGDDSESDPFAGGQEAG